MSEVHDINLTFSLKVYDHTLFLEMLLNEAIAVKCTTFDEKMTEESSYFSATFNLSPDISHI